MRRSRLAKPPKSGPTRARGTCLAPRRSRLRFAHLGEVTAYLAALNAYTSAVDAADAAGHSEAIIKSMVRDYQELISLELGTYPEAGKPIDPSPEGPLGPLASHVSMSGRSG